MTKFLHDGAVDWSCSECGAAGTFSFDGLETVKENPTRDDYIVVIARAEAEHATKCKGRLELEGAFRHRYIELFGRESEGDMTVKELIEKLNRMPEDAPVLVRDENDDVADLTDMELAPDVDEYSCQSLDTSVEGQAVVMLMGIAERGTK